MTPLLPFLLAPPLIDGLGDDPAWQQAVVVSGFVTSSPAPDQPPLGETTVALYTSPEGLHALVTMEDPSPADIRARLGRRDGVSGDDQVSLRVDLGAGGQRARVFVVTAGGVQADGVYIEGAGWDTAWDGFWESAAARTPTGWQAEVTIPWSALPPLPSADTLGLLVVRNIGRTGESSTWPRLDPARQQVLPQAGRFALSPERPHPRGVVLQPELTAGWGGEGPSSSSCWGWQGASVGMTGTWEGPLRGGGASVAGALNPDDATIEADGLVLSGNRRDALYFGERRPFFTAAEEGLDHPFSRIGALGSTDLLYTRSMVGPCAGVRGSVEAGRWRASALGVWDESPAGSVSEGGGLPASEEGGPGAAEGIARAWRRGEQGRGAGVVASVRSGAAGSNTVVGVDGQLRPSGPTRVEASLLGSDTQLAGEAHQQGVAGGLLASYRTGDLALTTREWFIGPEFRAENGFVTRADTMGGITEGNWDFYPDNEDGHGLTSFSVEPIDVAYAFTTQGEWRQRYWDPSVWIGFGNAGFAKLDVRAGGEAFAGAWLPTRQVDFYVETNAGQSGSLWVQATGGVTPFYDPSLPQSTPSMGVGGGGTIQPLPMLGGGLDLGGDRFGPLESAPLYADLWLNASASVTPLRALNIQLRAGLAADVTAAVPTQISEWGRQGEIISLYEPRWGGSLYPSFYLGGRYVSPPEGGLPPAWQVFSKLRLAWA